MRRLIVSLCPLVLVACEPQPAGPVMEDPPVFMDLVAVQPRTLPSPPVTVLIDSSPGQQVDPHVDGDIASYTDFAAGAQVRYYDFNSGVDLPIPTAGNNDQLSDVSGGRIVFTRILGDGSQAVMLFDANTAGGPIAVNPAAGSQRGAVAIGGNTIAYVDYGLPGGLEGEIVAWDLATSTATRLTTDSHIDQAPAVSSHGDVIAWERCPTTSLSNCDVVMAVKAGGIWTVSDVAATPDPEGFADTDGGTVAWTAHNGANYDVYWRGVAGGAVQQLALPGDQIHPAISGDVITFEGLSGGGTDLFAYHMMDGGLYQLTNTPGVNESLNDVTLLPGGPQSLHSVRVVWQANDGADALNDIHGATFTLPHGGFTTFRDRNLFLQNAGPVTEIDFDHDVCGAPIAAPSPGVLAGNRFATLGVTFESGVIFDAVALSQPASPPNVVTDSGVNTPTPALVRGVFSSDVFAVGITNVGAGAVLRLFDAAGNLIGEHFTDPTVPLDFVGVVSSTPARSFEYDFVAGIGFGGDDLLFTTIAQNAADCTPPQTTAGVTPAPNAAGWNPTPVTVTLTATDAAGGSGVRDVSYELTGAQSAPPVTTLGSAATFPIAAEGVTTVTYHAADNAGNVESPKTLAVRIDVTPPVLSLPASVTANATGPGGATVSYAATASDNLDPTVGVSCVPGPGTQFPIGTTAVACTATDQAGNAASGTFTVTVVGAPGQITDLLALVESFNLRQGIENSLDAKLGAAQSALAAAQGGNLAAACNQMDAFINEVRAQAGRSLTVTQAGQLIAAATNIRSVLGCQ